jgi:uncharacterized metal-binding protein YceD (DUF177 family)
MLLRGQGCGTLHLRCKRCNKIFPFDYGELGYDPTTTTKAARKPKREPSAVAE